MCEALRCDIRGDFAGLLVNRECGAKEQRVLLLLRLESLNRLPEVVVCVTRLESCKLEWINSCIVFKGSWKPSVSMYILDTIAMWCTANRENVELFGAGAKGEYA